MAALVFLAGSFLLLDLGTQPAVFPPPTEPAAGDASEPVDQDEDADLRPTTTTSTTILVREENEVPGWTVGEQWGTVDGLTMFRGNPTRTYYGSGVPKTPKVVWTYPSDPMCSSSSAGGESRVWCGMGWTGQPVVHKWEDGTTEVIFGAYDRNIHFVNGETGGPLRAPFPTGDLVKGSATLDPDGFPLVYIGSRDNRLRILAIDRGDPVELWNLNANAVNGIWNNDWDGNPVIVDDIMYMGGENGWFFGYELNRSIGDDGLVAVDPVQLVAIPGYDDELLKNSGRNVSIEGSVAIYEQTAYFGNSGGRVLGVDVSNVREGEAPIVFDYYSGGDIDASVVVDADGFLYVANEHEPSEMGPFERTRNTEVGQLIKLDPHADGDPLVWGIDLRSGVGDSGIWATPALHMDMLYVNTHTGDLLAVDTTTGSIVWSDEVGWHSWSSPSVVDETLVVATCTGEMRGYSLRNPRAPALAWSISLDSGCLEATPAIFDGAIYLGSRDGFIRAFR